MAEQAEHPAAESASLRTQEMQPADERALKFADIVRFFERHFLLILGCAGATGLLAFLVFALVVEPAFKASATLIVLPSQFKSRLKPPPLTVRAYQELLHSSTVVDAVIARLIEEDFLSEGETLRIGRDLDSTIFTSRRAEDDVLAPVIQVLAVSTEPEKAAVIANSWCLVFLDHVGKLVSTTVDPTHAFITSEFERAQVGLAELEGKEIALANDYRERIDGLTSSWDHKILAHRKATEDTIASYHADTRQELEQLPQDSVPGDDAASETSLLPPSDPLKRRLDRVRTLRIQLAQTLQLVTLEKAIPDEAFWEEVLSDEPAPLISESLRTQELNPVYQELALEVNKAEAGLAGLDQFERQQFRIVTSELERMQRRRTAGLTKLIAQRSQQLDALERRKHGEIEALVQERRMALGQIRREISTQKLLYGQLAENHSQAELARAERDAIDVRLTSPATPPRSPEPQNLGWRIMVALAVGAMLGLVVAGVREIHSQ